MNTHQQSLAARLLKKEFSKLSRVEQHVLQHVADRSYATYDTNAEFDRQLTFGQRLADRVASFGGSWPFIVSFLGFLLFWVLLNAYLLRPRGEAFDPFPFILLNLVLSMVAAFQAPIILMSQNRQTAKDRLDAAHDYEVNLKAELEILDLHHKLDLLRDQQWSELIAQQQEQIRLLKLLVNEPGSNAGEAKSSG